MWASLNIFRSLVLQNSKFAEIVVGYDTLCEKAQEPPPESEPPWQKMINSH